MNGEIKKRRIRKGEIGGKKRIAMKLPVNIDDLLTARTVEWERLEFKAGWNPKAVLHTMCAFANDFHNLGGGYIIIGVAEDKGRPVLPPVGLPINQMDAVQKEIVELGYRMVPYYHPIIAPYEIGGRHILVLWAAGGQTRPYKAPLSFKKGDREFAYYIRKGSLTVRARQHDETELMSLTATVPFDDRLNQQAVVEDLDLGLIRTYLKQVKSDLFRESAEMDFNRLCRQMNIVDGPDEYLWPRNVGLMFLMRTHLGFSRRPRSMLFIFPRDPVQIHSPKRLSKGRFTSCYRMPFLISVPWLSKKRLSNTLTVQRRTGFSTTLFRQ